MKSTEIKSIPVVHYGDLYRFYYNSDTFEILAIHFFAGMGTRGKDMTLEEIPKEVARLFERNLRAT